MLKARVATAVVLLVVCVSALLLLPNPWWIAVTLPVLAVAGWEWGTLARLDGTARWGYVALITLSALGVLAGIAPDLAFRASPAAGEVVFFAAACLFWLLAVPLWLARRWRMRIRWLLLLTGWAVLVPAWLAMARLQVEPERLLMLLGIVWLSDTAAYAAGRVWGRHKLAPSISPGKTWEGVAGAVVAVAVYYVIVSNAAPAWRPGAGWHGMLLFGGVAGMGVLGDLFESWIKRQAAVKDSGTLLPGHGGVLDRIDSLTAALPAAALLLAIAA